LGPEQRRIFILTYITYASYYLARLNFSVVLPSLGESLQYSKFTLGLIGAAFSISYAVGQFVNGQLADSFGAKRMILIGLALSAVMNALFGYVDLLVLLVLIWGINGYAQSTGWPSVVKIISNWFKSAVGTVGGSFGSCFLVGNMIAWPLLGYIAATYGWRAAFLTPPLILVIIAAVFYVGAKDKPEGTRQTHKTEVPSVKFRLKRILLSKRLITIALAYTLLQFVRSGFTLWAPSYLFEVYNLSMDVASYGAAAIPIGGIMGSIFSGWLSDRTRRFGRALVMFILIFSLSLTLLVFYYAAASNLQFGVILLFLLGFMLYGPHVLMVTVIPMEHEESHSVAGVAGFIDGVGYIGSTFADPFNGWIVDIQGWSGAVTFWFISALAAAFLMATLSRSELKGKPLQGVFSHL